MPLNLRGITCRSIMLQECYWDKVIFFLTFSYLIQRHNLLFFFLVRWVFHRFYELLTNSNIWDSWFFFNIISSTSHFLQHFLCLLFCFWDIAFSHRWDFRPFFVPTLFILIKHLLYIITLFLLIDHKLLFLIFLNKLCNFISFLVSLFCYLLKFIISFNFLSFFIHKFVSLNQSLCWLKILFLLSKYFWSFLNYFFP